jgi:pullulanase/glycogen debranching enzyme
MSSSINAAAVRTVLTTQPARVTPSPADWRDMLIYFLMVDRFNNPNAPPRNLPFDAQFGGFQGGTIAGMQAQLPYLKQLGVGAVWFTPVLFNGQMLNGAANGGTYHGYGIQDFLSIDPRPRVEPRGGRAGALGVHRCGARARHLRHLRHRPQSHR